MGRADGGERRGRQRDVRRVLSGRDDGVRGRDARRQSGDAKRDRPGEAALSLGDDVQPRLPAARQRHDVRRRPALPAVARQMQLKTRHGRPQTQAVGILRPAARSEAIGDADEIRPIGRRRERQHRDRACPSPPRREPAPCRRHRSPSARLAAANRVDAPATPASPLLPCVPGSSRYPHRPAGRCGRSPRTATSPVSPAPPRRSARPPDARARSSRSSNDRVRLLACRGGNDADSRRAHRRAGPVPRPRPVRPAHAREKCTLLPRRPPRG